MAGHCTKDPEINQSARTSDCQSGAFNYIAFSITVNEGGHAVAAVWERNGRGKKMRLSSSKETKEKLKENKIWR